MKQGKFTAALEQYDLCEQLDPNNPFVLLGRANAELGASPSITQAMANDQATHGSPGLTVPFHALPKWKWWLLHFGLRMFDEAAY